MVRKGFGRQESATCYNRAPPAGKITDPVYLVPQKPTGRAPKVFDMKANYDFSKSIKNPYVNKLKKQVTIRLENDTIDYFKSIGNRSIILLFDLVVPVLTASAGWRYDCIAILVGHS
jgi:hypothetical protein